jgi:hypothetical protein
MGGQMEQNLQVISFVTTPMMPFFDDSNFFSTAAKIIV